MPSSFIELFLFVTFLIPGFVHYLQRRAQAPQRSLSPLVEAATLGTISVATNAVTLALFAVVRWLLPAHAPEPKDLLLRGHLYAAPRLGYLLAWLMLLVVVSSALAWLLGARPGPVRRVAKRFAPAILDVSAWYHVFETGPEHTRVYVGSDLRDGSYVGGYLEWYSTELAETADRDFVLAAPISFRAADGREDQLAGFSRLLISAREVQRMYVSYVTEDAAAA